jgi:hypothetical protein
VKRLLRLPYPAWAVGWSLSTAAAWAIVAGHYEAAVWLGSGGLVGLGIGGLLPLWALARFGVRAALDAATTAATDQGE